MRKYSLYFFTFILLVKTVTVYSQDSTLQLENVIITASQSVQVQKESGRNIIAIKGTIFTALPVHSVDDLLRYLPGVEVQQRGPQGSQGDISIRGGTFQQVLIIIDGVRLNDPLTGHFSLYIPVHPEDIERVEILKGAAAAVWGSEAVGGVVNIITRSFADKKEPAAYKAKLLAGQYGLLNGSAYANWSAAKSRFSAGLLSNNTDGQLLRGTRGYFHLHTAQIAWQQVLKNDWQLNLRAAADLRKFNAQNYYTSFTSDTAHEQVNSGWIQASLRKKINKGSLQADAAYKQLRDQYWFRPAAVPNDNRSRLFTAQLFYTGQLTAGSSYTTGIQTIRRSIRSNDRGNHALWHGAAYAIFRHRLFNRLSLSESLRADWDESYGWVLVPQLNMAWNSGKLTIRGSAGRSFRDADFTERYNNYNKSLVTSGRIGNPWLEAEHSWSYEAGADYRITSRLRVSGTLFYRDHRNLIDWANTAYADMPRKDNLVPAGSYALARNVENIRTRGAELDFQYIGRTSPKSSLMTLAGFTWLRSVNEDPVPSLYISSHAKFLLNLSASCTVSRFSVSITSLYKQRAEQKSAPLKTSISTTCFLLNSKLGYSFSHNKAKLFIQADNLFDKKYSDLLGAILPGRWLSGGIEIAL